MPPTSPNRPAGASAPEVPWYVLQQGDSIWLEQSETRPDPKVPRGTKHIVVAFGPGSRDAAQAFGDRFASSAGAKWRDEARR